MQFEKCKRLHINLQSDERNNASFQQSDRFTFYHQAFTFLTQRIDQITRCLYIVCVDLYIYIYCINIYTREEADEFVI